MQDETYPTTPRLGWTSGADDTESGAVRSSSNAGGTSFTSAHASAGSRQEPQKPVSEPQGGASALGSVREAAGNAEANGERSAPENVVQFPWRPPAPPVKPRLPVDPCWGELKADKWSAKREERDREIRNRELKRERERKDAAYERRWHCVYKMFDAQDRLLYVGISVSAHRFKNHEAEKSWYRKVDCIKLEHVKGRTAALEREAELIVSLRPKYNVSGKPKDGGA
jgi:hypothetical protein